MTSACSCLHSHPLASLTEQRQQMMLSSRSKFTLATVSSSALQASTPISLGTSTIPWIFDSGASNHMASNDPLLTHTYSLSSPCYIYTADGSHLSAPKLTPLPLTLPQVCFPYPLYEFFLNYCKSIICESACPRWFSYYFLNIMLFSMGSIDREADWGWA